MPKSYNIKVYDQDRVNLVKTLNYEPTQPTDGSKDQVLLSAPRFNARKNGGLGVCKLEFNTKFDDFGDLSEVITEMNHFEIKEVSEDFPLGKLVYTGFLDSYDPVISKGKETVTANILGYASVLTFDDFRTSGGSTTVTYTATDPGQMARDIFTRINELHPLITWDASSIPLVGFTTDYVFENLTWKEAIDVVQKIAGVSFYWYIDQENKAHFKEKATSAQKKYLVGREVQEAKASVKSDEVKNRIVLTWSNGTITKTDAASISKFKQRTRRVSATNITTSTAADIQAQYLLDSSKDAITSISVLLNNKASFYDIQPGQTVKVQGLKKDQTIFGDNLQVEAISYTADTLTLSLEENKTLADDIKDIAETAQKF